MSKPRQKQEPKRVQRNDTAPYTPPETAVLTPKQLCRWLQISERQLCRIEGLPSTTLGGEHTRRYVVRDVLAWLQTEATKPREAA